MNLKPFKFKHFNDLIELHRSQGYDTSTITYATLPKQGYIAYLGTEPIAAGFLRRVEPSYAQIDTLVSNRFFGAAVRHEGITKVVDALIDDAKRLKLTGLLALTADEGVLKRAQALGFHIVPQTVIALKLP